MTDEEKLRYELARLALARLVGDASEIKKWSEAVSQTRTAEQRNEAVTTAQKCPYCGGHGADPMSDNVNWLTCPTCNGTGISQRA